MTVPSLRIGRVYDDGIKALAGLGGEIHAVDHQVEALVAEHGPAKEALKHKAVKRLTQVEIDASVVDTAIADDDDQRCLGIAGGRRSAGASSSRGG